AEIAQQHGAVGPGQDAGEVRHHQARQWPGARRGPGTVGGDGGRAGRSGPGRGGRGGGAGGAGVGHGGNGRLLSAHRATVRGGRGRGGGPGGGGPGRGGQCRGGGRGGAGGGGAGGGGGGGGTVIWGAAWQAAQSALIAPAVCSSSGRYSPVSTSTGVSAACVFTFSEAITWPSPSRSGAATERIPAASSSSVSAHPRARTSRSVAARSSLPGRMRGVIPDRLGSGRTPSPPPRGGAARSTLPNEGARSRGPGRTATPPAPILRTAAPGTYHTARALRRAQA